VRKKTEPYLSLKRCQCCFAGKISHPGATRHPSQKGNWTHYRAGRGALPFGCQYSQDQAVEKDKRWKRCWQRPPRSDVEQKRSRGIVTACGQRRAATDRLEAEKLEETPVLAKQPGQFDDHSRRPVPRRPRGPIRKSHRSSSAMRIAKGHMIPKRGQYFRHIISNCLNLGQLRSAIFRVSCLSEANDVLT